MARGRAGGRFRNIRLMAVWLDAESAGFPERFAALLARTRDITEDVDATVAAIVADVAARGDAAVLDHTLTFDHHALTPATMRISASEIDEAVEACDARDLDALQFAHRRILAFHARQMPQNLRFTDAAGVELGWRFTPIAAVGLYVPGGTAKLSFLGADERGAGQSRGRAAAGHDRALPEGGAVAPGAGRGPSRRRR